MYMTAERISLGPRPVEPGLPREMPFSYLFHWGPFRVFNRGSSGRWCRGAFVVQKREYIHEVNHVPEIPIYRGNANRARFIRLWRAPPRIRC